MQDISIAEIVENSEKVLKEIIEENGRDFN
jgi:hypothetical protein